MNKVPFSATDTEKMIKTPAIRRKLAFENMKYFFAIYLYHHIRYQLAPFHEEFFKIAEDEILELAIILAFRGSGKSTIFSLCYPIWAIIGKQQKKFVLILTQTQQQARIILRNIKIELESNNLLRADIGPFIEESDEWGSTTIVINKYGARIMVASTEQGIRGIKYGANRPDLIIFDDVQDITGVKTQEGRDKLFDWFTGDINPLGDLTTKQLIIGTRLHKDDLMSRFIQKIIDKEIDGVYCRFPVANENGESNWIGKYPNKEAIEKLRQKTASEIAWQREYMLNLVYSEDQLVKPEWIQYYDDLPPLLKLQYIIVGVDPAIGNKQSSDFTTMVPIYVFELGEEIQLYIGKQIINEHLTMYQTAVTGKQLQYSLTKGHTVTFVVETVAYQKALLEHMENQGLDAEAVTVFGQDKHIRLSMVTPYLEQLRVFFPREGAEDLITQLLGFPSESHDDLVDAFVYAVLKIQEEANKPQPNIRWLEFDLPLRKGLSDYRLVSFLSYPYRILLLDFANPLRYCVP